MSINGSFTRFCVKDIRPGKTIDATIEDNTLVVVGENGSGKTTFLRFMFSFLAGRWDGLLHFQFKEISAEIGGRTYVINHDDIANSIPRLDERMLARLPPSARSRASIMLREGRYTEATHIYEQYTNEKRFIGTHSLFEKLEKPSTTLSEVQEAVSKSLGAQILYLPTYRRIERELSSILRGIDIDDMRRGRPIKHQPEDADEFVELVEFGMGDVKNAIDSALENIRAFASYGSTQLTLGYLGDVVSQTYKSTNRSAIVGASIETIDAVLNRIGKEILSEKNKIQLRQIILSARETHNIPSEHEQIIYHYFSRLLNFQNELQIREQNITKFCDICSKYIVDKKFIYDSSRFSFQIKSTDLGGEIDLADLSSGEKQIVSLFSHLYLSGREHFFVLIDEPELSLSVPWQRRFLEDIRGGSFCSGLVAVTHSPFIYDNSMRKYTRALGEFVQGSDWGNIA